MNMKKGWLTVAALALILTLTLPLFSGQAGSLLGGTHAYADNAASPAADKHTITVTGAGELQVEPDVAYISIGVQSEGTTANEAQTVNAKAFSSLNDKLKKAGIAEKDIKLTSFSVQPQYKYANNEKPKLVGYTASHYVQVTYRKMDAIGKLLDEVSAAGANIVNGIQFSTEKQHDYELQALKLAMDNAKAKADVLAKASGGSIKGVLNVTENSSSQPPRIYASYSNEKADMSASASGTSISSGQLTINTNVTVQYEF